MAEINQHKLDLFKRALVKRLIAADARPTMSADGVYHLVEAAAFDAFGGEDNSGLVERYRASEGRHGLEGSHN